MEAAFAHIRSIPGTRLINETEAYRVYQISAGRLTAANAARYSGAAAAEVDCEITDSRAVIRFMDDGRPYNPTAQPEPDATLSAADREIGGLGISMVKKSVDRVTWS